MKKSIICGLNKEKFISFILLTILNQLALSQTDNSINIHNSLNDIVRVDTHIDLKLMREWGGEKETDANKMFYSPMDIACDINGDLDILEKTKILKFDKDGKFKVRLGGPGQGPGEFLSAIHLVLDSNNKLVVYDSDNRRIQILNQNGSVFGSVSLQMWNTSPLLVNKKNEIIMYNTAHTAEPTSLWQFFNYQGRLTKEVGVRNRAKSAIENSRRYSFNITCDDSSNIFAAAVYRPIIDIYSESGELAQEISYELPFEIPEIKAVTRPEGEFVESEIICRGIAIDSKRRIYILGYRRMKSVEERKIGISFMSSSNNYNSTNILKPNIDPSKSDLFQILIFNESGKIVSSNKLDIYANKIRIFHDRLFIIDSYVNMNIHEFSISN